MIPILTTGDALLADVLATPEDDAPRLILADWLQDEGQLLRAELIRVQCELARWPCECDSVEQVYHEECRCKEKADLQRRRKQLLTPDHFWAWFASQPGVWDRAWSGRPAVHIVGDVCEVGYWTRRGEPDHWKFTITRGFVSTVKLPMQAWLDHGKALVRYQPITRVLLSDKEPEQYPNGGLWHWQWQRSGGDGYDQSAVIDEQLYDWVISVGIHQCVTKQAAIDALSTACLRYARE